MEESARRFYSALARVYDQLFPAEETITRFLKDHVPHRAARVLDLACGTGTYTDALSARGVDVFGIDGSEELIALGKTRSRRPERLSVLDMNDLGELASGPFDLVFCIGNSIPHLGSIAEVQRLLHTIARNLVPTVGRVVIQYVDVSALRIGESRDLPTLSAAGVQFDRRYTKVSNRVARFSARLMLSGNVEDLSNDLLVLSEEELGSWFSNAGLRHCDTFGDFSGGTLAGSWMRIMTAERSAP